VTPGGFLADTALPVLRTLKINGYLLYYPRRLAKRLNGSGSLTPERTDTLRATLAERFPPWPGAPMFFRGPVR
jgi:hypothetical protein